MSFKSYVDRIENRVVNTVHYEAFIFVGILIAILSLIKVLGIYDFSSDWLWFLA